MRPEETARGWAATDGLTLVIQETDVDPLLYAHPYWWAPKAPEPSGRMHCWWKPWPRPAGSRCAGWP
ncbi:hypothetical protein ABR737_05520 [Streptomyces sp. Edi2]|uniref:hypothetical protein n=1 Tax=Streptomyces sp. Edi2 TaxID=3162528 RepID=UPI003305C6DC